MKKFFFSCNVVSCYVIGYSLSLIEGEAELARDATYGFVLIMMMGYLLSRLDC